MRGIVKTGLAVLTAAVLTGMGSMGGTPEGTVPHTSEDIKVQLVDRKGVTVELSRFSMDGKVFLEGNLGEGTMSVNFDDLKDVSFGPVAGDTVPADLLLKSDRHLQLKVSRIANFYGVMEDGVYRISVQNTSRIIVRK
jgi:hypothetical protein